MRPRLPQNSAQAAAAWDQAPRPPPQAPQGRVLCLGPAAGSPLPVTGTTLRMCPCSWALAGCLMLLRWQVSWPPPCLPGPSQGLRIGGEAVGGGCLGAAPLPPSASGPARLMAASRGRGGQALGSQERGLWPPEPPAPQEVAGPQDPAGPIGQEHCFPPAPASSMGPGGSGRDLRGAGYSMAKTGPS